MQELIWINSPPVCVLILQNHYKTFQIIPPGVDQQCGSHTAGMYSTTWDCFGYMRNIRMRNNWINMWKIPKGLNQGIPHYCCAALVSNTPSQNGRNLRHLELWERWKTNEETLRLSRNLSPVLCLLSLPSTPLPSHVFSRWRIVFAVSSPVNPISSPPLSSSSLFFLLCPSHPLVLTPELCPLKSPGNKPWCLGSSLLSRSPHPSSPSGDTSAVKVSLVQKAWPLHSVQYKRIGLSHFSAFPLFSLSLFLPLFFFAARVLCVQCAMLTVAALCQKNPHKHIHIHVSTHIHSHRHTAGPQLHTKTGVWKSMKEKEEKGKGV